MEGAKNDENATFALLMHAYDKAVSFPFLPCFCCLFLASSRFLINTEKDRSDINFSIVDQKIKLTDRKHPWQKRGLSCLISFTRIRPYPIASHSNHIVVNRARQFVSNRDRP